MPAIDSVMRAILREAETKLGTPARAPYAGRVWDDGRDPLILPLVTPFLAIQAATLEQLRWLTRQVLDIARGEAACRRLMSVPAVGSITSLALRATIDQPERFRRSPDVGPLSV